MTGDLNLLEKLPQAQNESSNRVQRIAHYLIASIAIVCLAACISTASLMKIIRPDDYLALVVYGCFGSIAAGPIACVILAALVTFKLSVRVAALTVALALILADLAIGASIASGENELDKAALELLPAVPIAVLGLATAFVFARYLLGWQIVFASLHDCPTRQQVSVAGLLISTAIVAVCFALLRISKEPLTFVALAGVLAGAGFIVLMPMVFLFMRTRYYWIYFGLFCAAAFPIGFLVSYLFAPYRRQNDGWACFGFGVTATTCMALIGLAIIACRLAGGKLFVSTDSDIGANARFVAVAHTSKKNKSPPS